MFQSTIRIFIWKQYFLMCNDWHTYFYTYTVYVLLNLAFIVNISLFTSWLPHKLCECVIFTLSSFQGLNVHGLKDFPREEGVFSHKGSPPRPAFNIFRHAEKIEKCQKMSKNVKKCWKMSKIDRGLKRVSFQPRRIISRCHFTAFLKVS